MTLSIVSQDGTVFNYGYLRSPDDKNTWILDETASEVVKSIFDMYLNQAFSTQQLRSMMPLRN